MYELYSPQQPVIQTAITCSNIRTEQIANSPTWKTLGKIFLADKENSPTQTRQHLEI